MLDLAKVTCGCLMQSFLRRLAHVWVRHVHPRLVSFIAFTGIIWLAVCLLLIYGLAELSEEVLEQEAFIFDEAILLEIHKVANPVLDRVMLSVTHLGNPEVVMPLTVVSFGILWWRRDRITARIFGLNCLGGAILSTGLKIAFGKPRPQLWDQLITETTYSFPSGHALGSMVLYGFLSYLLARRYPHHAYRYYGLATLLIVSIGFSRLYLGVHWPTDVLSGYGVGFLWLSICIGLLRLQKNKSV